MSFCVRPLSAALGAEIEGLDLATPPGDNLVREVQESLARP